MKYSFLQLTIGVLFFFNTAIGWADASYQLLESDIEYKVTYTFKTVVGHSKSAKGKGACDDSECQFLVAVPIKEFKSGDRNRDIKTLEVTKAAVNPLVVMSLKIPLGQLNKSFTTDVEIQFAGVKKTIKNVPFELHEKGGEIEVDSHFDLLLSDFNVERPTLLTIPIDNKVPIKIHSTWKS